MQCKPLVSKWQMHLVQVRSSQTQVVCLPCTRCPGDHRLTFRPSRYDPIGLIWRWMPSAHRPWASVRQGWPLSCLGKQVTAVIPLEAVYILWHDIYLSGATYPGGLLVSDMGANLSQPSSAIRCSLCCSRLSLMRRSRSISSCIFSSSSNSFLLFLRVSCTTSCCGAGSSSLSSSSELFGGNSPGSGRRCWVPSSPSSDEVYSSLSLGGNNPTVADCPPTTHYRVHNNFSDTYICMLYNIVQLFYGHIMVLWNVSTYHHRSSLATKCTYRIHHHH